ncbi:MAG: EscV/YscV/HrcV family type III secretion system export apparatus protein [Verrucomicrobia bacterium RIFCSPHIGHO2_12_FULL_41_10]|nr:MAG: EscV/YscV/HrcV family type III secretion system export apparatus protein [Verrucomicrobia bacterium RIFCSPHIGHO2_12_FULL_41_10]
MNEFLEQFQGWITRTRRFGDLYVAFLIIAIIALFILPVPPWVLDSLISLNLTISIVLLMMALYVPNVLAFSTFPSILLITTLFRLSLNITSTRMILLNAYAGEIIYAFGSFVVGGNFVVGVVVWMILLVVQFIVVTKGAERVAEVAARFTLDAMPGKQMSIDADMRAGVIDIKEAQKRRSNVEKESQVFGSMDGAMKFVKGDAIATLIIVSINIIAGITIGVVQKMMPIGEAVQTYSILSIGDALVSQIPGLLITITAGIIVTRVGSEEKEALGSDILNQILSVPKALLIGGVILAFFALVPGFPKIQFGLLSIVVLVLGYMLQRGALPILKKGSMLLSSGQKTPSAAAGAPATAPDTSQQGDEFSITVPVLLEIDAAIQESISPEALNTELVQVRRALYYDLGVPFPGIHLRFNENFKKGQYQLLLQEVPMSTGILRPDYLYVKESQDHLLAFHIPFEPVENPPDLVPAVWVPVSQQHLLQQVGLTGMDSSQLLSFHISLILKKYAADFIGLQETRTLLSQMEPENAEIVREVQRVLPATKIAEVLQRLVQEEISIRNLRTILQALIEWAPKEKDTLLLTEYVRIALRRYISYYFSGGRNVLVAYILEPSAEEQIRKSVRQTSAGSFLAMDPAMSKRLVDAVKKEVGDISNKERPPVLITSMDVRRYMKKLIELDIPQLAVLSHQELTEEINIQPLGRIGL